MLWLQLKPDKSKGIHNKPRQREKLDMQENLNEKKVYASSLMRELAPPSPSRCVGQRLQRGIRDS